MKLLQDIGRPLFVPQDHRERRHLPGAVLDALRPEVLANLDGFLAEPSAESFWRLEERVLASFQLAASHVVAAVLALVQRDGGWVQAATDVARDMTGRRLRHRGQRTTPVRFLGGACLLIETAYLSEDLSRRAGSRRGVGRRGATGTGCYPVLEALGITHQATPALSSEVARQAVRAASFQEARQALAERGIVLDEKTVRTLALKVGEEALEHRQARIEAAAAEGVCSDEFAGRRLVLSTDGGRVRLREGGNRGRRFGTGPYDVLAAFDPAEISVREKLSAPPVRLGADDWERVHASRVARRGAHGSIVVDDPRWTRSELMRRESAVGLGFEDPATGELTHHLFAVPQGGESETWQVVWLAYRTPKQLRELLTVLSSLSDQLKLIRLVEPPGIQVQSLVDRPFRRRGLGEGGKFESTSRVFAWWQARILDLEACVAATRLPGSASVTFGLDLTDPVTEYLSPATREQWPGVAGEWTVTLGPESGAARGTEKSGLPRLRTSVNAFTRLWLGTARPGDLPFLAPDFDAPADLLASLDRVLRLPPPHPDWDI